MRHLFLTLLLLAVQIEAQPAAKDTSATAPARTILFFGDSLTSGYGIEPEQAYPTLIQAKIDSLGWSFTAINAGVSGETSAAGLRRIDWILRRKVDVFVLELGANDGLRGVPLESMKRNLQAIIDRVKEKYPQALIVIAGMMLPLNLGPDYTRLFGAIFPQLAEKNEASLIPFLLEGVGGVPALNLPDGVHPNPEGQIIVAENVWKVLKPLLEKPAQNIESKP